MIFTLIQNFESQSEYEYAKVYTTIEEAKKDLQDYELEDTELGVFHHYTIVDSDYNDIDELEQREFYNQAMFACMDIGLPQDEAEIMVNDYMLIF